MKKNRRASQPADQPEKKIIRFQPADWVGIGIVLLLTIVAYWQVHSFTFLSVDDPDYITQNGHVLGGLTAKNIAWAFTTFHASNYHPLTWLSHQLDCQLFGASLAALQAKAPASGPHLVNLLLHLVNVFLVFLVFRRATGAVWRSCFVAGLFALHPLHVESIAWVAERKDVLSTCFWMLTMLAYVYYAEKPEIRRYLLVVGAFTLGLLAKPMLVTLPIVLLLLDYWPLKRMEIGWRKLLIEKAPLAALTLISSLITVSAQRHGGALQTLNVFPFPQRIANSIVGYGSYLARMIAPINLGPLYPHPGNGLPTWMIAASGCVILGMTAAAIGLARRVPYLTFGWFFYFITLIPVIQIVQVGQQGTADRYTYIPLIGIFVIIAWMIPDALESIGKYKRETAIALGATGAVILIVLTVLTYRQAQVWHNDTAYNERMLQATHDHPLNRALEVKYLAGKGKTTEAMELVEKLVRENPDMPDLREAHAYVFCSQGRYAEAVAEVRNAIKLRPTDAEDYNNLGVTLDSWGKSAEALQWLKKAVQMAPDTAQFRANLAHAYIQLNKPDDAIANYRIAIRVDPDLTIAHRDLGVVLYKTQDPTGAIEQLDLAVESNPQDAMSQYLLGFMQQANGYNNEAISHLEAAIKLRPTWPDAHGVLAMALNAIGSTEEAKREYDLAKKYGIDNRPPPAAH